MSKLECQYCKKLCVSRATHAKSTNGTIVRYRKCSMCQRTYKTYEIRAIDLDQKAIEMLEKMVNKENERSRQKAESWKRSLRRELHGDLGGSQAMDGTAKERVLDMQRERSSGESYLLSLQGRRSKA